MKPYIKYEDIIRKPVEEWTNEEEVWKDIKGWEGLYEVSNYGRVRNMKRGNFLTVIENNSVHLSSIGRKKNKLVHNAMMEVFFPLKEENEYEKELRQLITKQILIQKKKDPILYYHRNNWYWFCRLKD